jgi:hypothetical protein
MKFTLDESITADSPCGDWEPYKEEKCFKIFDKAGLQSYEDAEKTCQQQENGSSLITVHFLEEQEFISNLFKTQKVANDIWIGVKYTNNKYKWEDDSDLVFTNWEQGSPKNQTDHCVQLLSDENSFGKWSDVLCNRKNLVVCQKMQTWSLSNLQKLLLNTIKNPFPIGFIYVQLPNEKSPTEIWPWMTWKDITSAYAGLFFRAEGGGSEKFGNVQGDDSPRLISVKDDVTECKRSVQNIVPGTWSSPIASGKDGCDSILGLQFLLSSVEVRPRNMAIRVWKRTT